MALAVHLANDRLNADTVALYIALVPNLRVDGNQIVPALDLQAAWVPRAARAVIEERLRSEPVHSVKLALALALGTHDPAAYATLVALSESATLTGAETAARGNG